MADHVDLVLRQWREHRPDLDVASMAVVARLSRAAQVVGNELRRTFTAHELDPASFDLLATLRRNDPERGLTPSELRQSAMVTSGAITQRLDRLVALGHVVRVPSRTDGRVVQVRLTPTGRDVIDAALEDHVRTLDRLVHGLETGERDQLAALLRRLLESHGDRSPE